MKLIYIRPVRNTDISLIFGTVFLCFKKGQIKSIKSSVAEVHISV